MRISDWSSDVCSSDRDAGGRDQDVVIVDLGVELVGGGLAATLVALTVTPAARLLGVEVGGGLLLRLLRRLRLLLLRLLFGLLVAAGTAAVAVAVAVAVAIAAASLGGAVVGLLAVGGGRRLGCLG